MAITGSCLCGGVRFEIERANGPSEICHCVRCQKKSGASALEMIAVETKHYHLLAGEQLIQSYEAPILNNPPAYTAYFCGRCGSPVPNDSASTELMEIPAGLFDDDPQARPDKHIFVDFMPAWNVIRDGLPQFDLRQLIKHRFGRDLPSNYQAKDHQGRMREV